MSKPMPGASADVHASAVEPLDAAPPVPTDPRTGYVEATVNHVVKTREKPVIHIAPPGGGNPRRVAPYEPHMVRIHDARPIASELSLDKEGLALVRQETAVSDFYDDEEVRAVYHPEVERLVKEATGAAKVVVFDHTIRTDGAGDGGDNGTRNAVRTVHNDYTVWSGPQRVRDLLDDAEALLEGRFAVVNVWRPIRGPVERAPLAVADARSMAPEDFVAADLVYEDRTGEIYDVAFNPDHRWYYFPNMERDEVMLLKCYDSAQDGRARFTAHTAFDDPTTTPDAAPRESIEIRTLVFFDRD